MPDTQERIQGGLVAGAVTTGQEVAAQVDVTGLIQEGVAAGLTASTTHSIAGGTPLTAEINQVSTVANAGDAGTLLALAPGQHQDVYNDGAHAMAVYPASNAYAIDGGSAGGSVTLTNAKRCRYTCMSAGVIESAQLGVPSA